MFEEKDLKEDALDCLNICIKQCRDLELNDEGIEILNLIKENYVVWKTDNSKKIKPSSIDILDQYKQNEIKKPIEIFKKTNVQISILVDEELNKEEEEQRRKEIEEKRRKEEEEKKREDEELNYYDDE